MTMWRLYLTGFLITSTIFRITHLVFAVRKARSHNRGRTSARPIFWVMTGSYLLYLGVGSWESLRRAEPISWAISLLGLFLYVAALILRNRVMADLGRFFSPDIEVRPGHRVIREGFYAWVRHPLLVCMVVELMGLGLFLNAFRTLLFLGVCGYLPLIRVRQYLEEKTLLHQLGDEYRIYQRDVGGLLPRWRVFMELQRSYLHA
jgi:protein-S-isoprenylcysteine O-methyltransferase Ste14